MGELAGTPALFPGVGRGTEMIFPKKIWVNLSLIGGEKIQ